VTGWSSEIDNSPASFFSTMPFLEEAAAAVGRQLDQAAQALAPAAPPKPKPRPVLSGRRDLARISPQPDRLVTVEAARVPLLEAARPLLDALARMPGQCDAMPLDSLHQVLLREVVSFQSVCQDAGLPYEHVLAASYMLCTALDEAASNSARGNAGEAAPQLWTGGLAPYFHGDARGGEGVFRILGFLVNEPQKNLDLLELTLLVLTLGFEGLYRRRPSGRRVLHEIRMRVHALVYIGRGGTPSPRWTAIERLLKRHDFSNAMTETTEDIFS
jgi:type VI secretion system protein ImpK